MPKVRNLIRKIHVLINVVVRVSLAMRIHELGRIRTVACHQLESDEANAQYDVTDKKRAIFN